MRKREFSFDLPAELIAQQPLAERTASRLLVLRSADDAALDAAFRDLGRYLRAGDLLVFNDTRVLPARLACRKPSGGRVELLLERIESEHEGLFQARSNKPLRRGQRLVIDGGAGAEVTGQAAPFVRVVFDAPLTPTLHAAGEVPLPPYIRRAPDATDSARYQTVYARNDGAVAAPTAGLHFDEPLLASLRAAGIETAHLTLHVAAGTFKPLPDSDLDGHRLHRERLAVSGATCAAVNAARAAGRRIVAVGTTVVRALEAAWRGDELVPFAGDTQLFIQPGYRFRAVDVLLTNFHLPESSLLMLVCAFGGRARVLRAYRHAVAAGYRFFSYGDAMFVEAAPAP